MKCFLVDCEQDEGSQLYFAETANQAKCYAANEAGIDYVEVTSCRRRPQYDQYAPGPVPTKVLIEDGWWFECSGCSRHVSDDESYDYDEDKPLDGPVYRGDRVWCSARCQELADEREAKQKQEEQAVKDAVLAKWPKAEKITPFSRGDHKQCAWFNFGGKNTAQWVVGEDVVHVAGEDTEAWHVFSGKKETPHAE